MDQPPRSTRRQAELLTWMRRYIVQHGMPPTRQEIAQAFGFRSPNAAESHLRAMARRGLIELQAGTARGIRLLDVPAAAPSMKIQLPLVGRVAAGLPMLAQQNIEEHLSIDARRFRPAADYLLRVYGDSMRDAGILNADLLAVHRTSDVQNGQIVVARIDDEVTVKRLRRDGEQVWLLAANPDFAPLCIDLRRQALHIEGLGVGVIRERLDGSS